VKLQSTSEYDAPVDAVEAALLDPAFWAQLQLSNMAPPQVVTSAADSITVHMTFAGTLDALGKRVIGNQGIAWDQTITIDRAAHAGTLAMRSKVRVNVTAEGTFRFESLDGGSRSRETLTGEMKVHVPLVGGKIEGILGPGIQKSFDEQAQSLQTWLTGP
jgi:hypothetical protein